MKKYLIALLIFPPFCLAQESLVASTVSSVLKDVARPEIFVFYRIYGEILVTDLNCNFISNNYYVELINTENSRISYIRRISKNTFKFESDRFAKGNYLLKIKSERDSKTVYQKPLIIIESGSQNIYPNVCN